METQASRTEIPVKQATLSTRRETFVSCVVNKWHHELLYVTKRAILSHCQYHLWFVTIEVALISHGPCAVQARDFDFHLIVSGTSISFIY